MARGQKSPNVRGWRLGAHSGDTQGDTDDHHLTGIATQLVASPFARRRLLKFLRTNLRRGKGDVVYSEALQPGQRIVITHLTDTRADEKRQARADKKAAKAADKETKRAEKEAKRAEKKAKRAEKRAKRAEKAARRANS